MEPGALNQLFVYSSLLEGFHDKAFDYISRHFTFVCNAKVKGILSDVRGRARCTPTLDNIFTKGELYKLNDKKYFSWAFGQLDDYEGTSAAGDDHPLYLRSLAIVYKDDGRRTKAWIYWYNGEVAGRPEIDSVEVLEYLRAVKI